MSRIFQVLVLCGTLLVQVAPAEANSLQPKYGGIEKNDAMRAADAKFLASIDEHYKGDRKKASSDIAQRGWELLRQGNAADAMRRFNQAWMLDSRNGIALWGMGACEAGQGRMADALALFNEAAPIVGADLDFAVDHAKTMGLAGLQSQNEKMVKEAFGKFQALHAKAPQHTLNLQNWSVLLFYIGNYAEAWKKIKLAEATPRKGDLDPKFIKALQEKMPRP